MDKAGQVESGIAVQSELIVDEIVGNVGGRSYEERRVSKVLRIELQSKPLLAKPPRSLLHI